MKRIIAAFILGLLTTIPLYTFSASTLAAQLQGKILLAVEDHGKTYFVHEDGQRYRVTSDTAQSIFEELALGITNSDLDKIPEGNVGIDPEGNSNLSSTPDLSTSTCEDDGYEALYEEALLVIENSYDKDSVDELLEEYQNLVLEYEDYLTQSYDNYDQCNANYWDLYSIYYSQSQTLSNTCMVYYINCPDDLQDSLDALHGRGLTTSSVAAKQAQIILDYIDENY